MCRWNLFYCDLRVCTELQVLSRTASRLWFYAYKKYKNGNSARRTATKRHIRPPIYYSGSDNFSSGISGKLPKIATLKVIFSKTADRIAVKFCMTIKKINPNNTFQNCVHSCSTLSIESHFVGVQRKRCMKICFSFQCNSYGPWTPTKCDSILIFTSFYNKVCRSIAYFNTKMSHFSDFKCTKSKTLRTASTGRMTNWKKAAVWSSANNTNKRLIF